MRSIWSWFAVKFLPWGSFCQQSSSPLPQLNKYTDNAISNVSFQTVKARQSAKQTTELAKAAARENDSDDETCEKGSGLLYCPEEGHIKSFQHFSSSKGHLNCGKDKYALEPWNKKRCATRQ